MSHVVKQAVRVVRKHWKLIALTTLKFIAQRPASTFEERVQQTLRQMAGSLLDLQGEV